MRSKIALALLCAVAVPAAGQAPRPTTQQQFDAAQAASDTRNWAEALRQLDALETRVRNNPRTLGLVRVRRGVVLVALARLEEAAAAIRLGLPALPADDPSLVADRFVGLMNLGRIAEHDLDYPEALSQYRLAAALPVQDADRLVLYRGMIQTQTFSDVEAALRDADAALAIIAAAAPANRALAGEFHTLKGRALLNLRRYPEARRELEDAMRLLGNLTMRVDRADLIARSDLAIAALLAGDPDDARRYLAYTGAGQFDRGWFRPRSTEPPRCGPEIAPEDVVVIEAIIATDGSVVDAKPIYASRQGPGAIAFAQAVRRWSFEAESLDNIPLLFRTVVRIEVRCSERPRPGRYAEDNAVLDRLAAADPAWGRAIAERRGRPTGVLRAELAALDRGPNPSPRDRLPLLLLLADSIQVPAGADLDLRLQALSIAGELGAPPPVLASIAVAIANDRAVPARPGRPRNPPDFAAVLARPEIARSAHALALVRLSQGRWIYRQRAFDDALAIVRAVRAMPEAQPGSDLFREAQELEVAVLAARGQVAAARAAHQAIGPDAARCGVSPPARPVRVSSSDFPNAAARWGFEGWATNEVSIAPDGSIARSRTIVAYPPFVFGDAARDISLRARYEPIYVPDGAPCPSDFYRVVFRMPAR